MPYRTPTSFTAARRFKLSGVVYFPGDEIPMGVARGLRKLEVLVANGWIVPDADPYSRRGKVRPRPFSAPPKSRQKYDETPPVAVTDLVASDETDTSITLSWVNPVDIDLEKVIVRRAVGAVAPATYRSGTGVALASDLDETVVVSGLTELTEYSFAVFVKDASGNVQSQSATVTASTIAGE